MREISRIAAAVSPSTTLAIDAMFKKMREDGIDVVGFGAGEPDFNTPNNVKMAGIKAINDNFTKYTPAAGTIPLRKAIVERMRQDIGVEYEPTQVVVASGAKHNVFIALTTLTNPGDEVILPTPFWVSYYELIKMVGCTPVEVMATEKAHFKMTAQQLEEAITDKTSCLILNNPSNPTGMLYSKEELEAIAQVCKKHDIYVIADEIYYGLVYDNKEFVSFASISDDAKERTVLINGVSKSYAMTGWRVGYAMANPQVAKVMANYLSHSTGAPSSISQMAALEAVSGPQDGIEEMRKAFEQRRNYLVNRMNTIEGVSCIKPDGAFYVMQNCEKLKGRTIGGVLIENGDDFAKVFLEQGLVAVVPCSGFGAPDFVRWSYATSMDNIKKGLDRLENLLK